MLDIEVGMNRLKETREARRYTLEQIADAIGTTFATVQRWEAGTRNVSLKWLEKLASFYKIPVSDLVATQDIFYKDSVNNSLQPKVERVLPTQFGPDMIPILGHANASSSAIMLNYEEPIGEAPRHPKLAGVKNAYYVEVYDESMSPRYYPRELAAVNGNRSPLPKEDCVIQLNNGEVYIKQFIKTTDKKIICHQLNPSQSWDCLIGEVKAIHAVVGRG